MVRKYTPIEEIERFAERLLTAYPNIADRITFDLAFDDYMEVMNENQDKILREKTWDEIRTERPQIKDEKRPTLKEQKKIRAQQEYTYTGKMGKKIVYARKDFVIIKELRIVKFRDRKGRFVRVIE